MIFFQCSVINELEWIDDIAYIFRPESREVGQESTIYGPQETTTEHSTSGPILPSRLTPLMFSRPHVCARVSASGLLVKVEAHSPREGQSATVELHSVSSLLQHTQNYKELSIFPGPLKPKVCLFFIDRGTGCSWHSDLITWFIGHKYSLYHSY